MDNLNMELEYVPCNLCGGNDLKFLYKKPDTTLFVSDIEFSVVRCRSCGLAFVNPRPTPDSIRVFYPKKYYKGIPSHYERYETEARYLEDLKPGKVLDIGCASGAFLKVLLDRGWEVYGMDFWDTAENEYDLDIRYGSLENIQYPSQNFDAVTAWAVFEHLHNPMKYFKEVFRILKTGGRLLFLVTNINSLMSRWCYAEDIPRHLYFFSEKTIAQYARECGFSLNSIHFSNDIYHGQGRDVFRVNFLRWLGVPWENMFSKQKRLLLRAAAMLGSILGVFLIRPSLELRFRRSGTIVVTMTKH